MPVLRYKRAASMKRGCREAGNIDRPPDSPALFFISPQTDMLNKNDGRRSPPYVESSMHTLLGLLPTFRVGST